MRKLALTRCYIDATCIRKLFREEIKRYLACLTISHFCNTVIYYCHGSCETLPSCEYTKTYPKILFVNTYVISVPCFQHKQLPSLQFHFKIGMLGSSWPPQTVFFSYLALLNFILCSLFSNSYHLFHLWLNYFCSLSTLLFFSSARISALSSISFTLSQELLQTESNPVTSFNTAKFNQSRRCHNRIPIKHFCTSL